MFEVEIKFAVPDPESFLALLKEEFGLVFGEEIFESDLFFQHPNRDFAQSDECLRIRRHKEQILLTYKGPKIDSSSKTREEIELSLGDPDLPPEKRLERSRELLNRLDFCEKAHLEKYRRSGVLNYQNRRIAITLDRIPELGFFTEMELEVEFREEVEEARSILFGLASDFRLENGIRTSYLELFLAKKREIESIKM
ncbi:MAG: class IV adenylate cyclase [Planctomycetia bacterium]|nr:class IV adenylate cyclase [Planctomycetia bacterium]